MAKRLSSYYRVGDIVKSITVDSEHCATIIHINRKEDTATIDWGDVDNSDIHDNIQLKFLRVVYRKPKRKPKARKR